MRFFLALTLASRVNWLPSMERCRMRTVLESTPWACPTHLTSPSVTTTSSFSLWHHTFQVSKSSKCLYTLSSGAEIISGFWNKLLRLSFHVYKETVEWFPIILYWWDRSGGGVCVSLTVTDGPTGWWTTVPCYLVYMTQACGYQYQYRSTITQIVYDPKHWPVVHILLQFSPNSTCTCLPRGKKS